MNALSALVAFALGLAPAAVPSAAPARWETLYEAGVKAQWFTAVWLKSDGSWRAGGKDLIVSGDAAGVRTTAIEGFVVYAFGEDKAGGVVAVGSRQGVWEERGTVFERVHERPGPPRTGRAAHKDVLEGVRYLDPQRPERLVAYGSLHLTVSKEPNQAWRSDENDDVASRGSLGPELKPPAGCHTAGWHWVGFNDGILDCHEGMAYLYSGPTPASLGQLPHACGMSMRVAVRDGPDVFVVCGQKGQIWRQTSGEREWTPVAGVTGVQALQARGGCILVATTRAILRQCAGGANKSAGTTR